MENKTGLKIIVAILMLPVVFVIFSLALRDLWNWFVAPLGAPTIGMYHAYGLSLVCRLVIFDLAAMMQKKEQTLGVIIGWSIVTPLLLWGTGWILHLLM